MDNILVVNSESKKKSKKENDFYGCTLWCVDWRNVSWWMSVWIQTVLFFKLLIHVVPLKNSLIIKSVNHIKLFGYNCAGLLTHLIFVEVHTWSKISSPLNIIAFSSLFSLKCMCKFLIFKSTHRITQCFSIELSFCTINWSETLGFLEYHFMIFVHSQPKVCLQMVLVI